MAPNAARPHASRVSEPTDLEILGHQIRILRLTKFLSQEALADMAEINRNHLSSIERGKKAPTVTVLLKLAAALGVSPGKLLEPFEGRG